MHECLNVLRALLQHHVAGMHLHTPVFVVMGHEGCGAVQAALAPKFHGAQQASRIETLLENILPALDNAINLQAAKIKKIASPVAGRANVLVVPDREAGNMRVKSPTFLAGAGAAPRPSGDAMAGWHLKVYCAASMIARRRLVC